MVCLERLMPRLSAGGSVIIDDYFVYSGCRTAVWDYFRQRQDEYQFIYGPRLKIYRPPASPER
jgi:asparagine synthase (glutamine-hydrolysing)